MKHIILFLLFCLSLPVVAQRQRNYIYVFDCTRSMIYKTDLFTPAKQWLREDIERQDAEATITVFPFRENVLDRFSFKRSAFKWEDIEKKLNEYVAKSGGKTGICHTWDEAIKTLDPHKDNYFYLLTDGIDDCSPLDSLQLKINGWCKDNGDAYGFYVYMNAVARRGLKLSEMGCDHFFFIDGTDHLAPFGTFDKNVFNVNLRDLKPKTLAFSTAGSFRVKASCSDPYFDVEVVGGQIRGGKAVFRVKEKEAGLVGKLPETYQFAFSLSADAKRLNLLTDTIFVNVQNKAIPNLDIVSEEQSGSASWYPRFLFWPEAKQDTIDIDLHTTWNDDARRQHSCLRLANKPDDYQLLLNGKPVTAPVVLDASHDGDILSVVFNRDARSEEHYLEFKGEGERLATVNDNDLQADGYTLTLRLKYHVGWNPLQWILFILALTILGALLVWFVVLRRIFYPTFSVRTIQITEPYYKMVKLRGARGAVLSSKAVKQSTLSRIFTGRIVSEVHPSWVDPIELTPARKGARMKMKSKYTVVPYSLMLQKQHDYELEHTDSRTRYNLSVN